MVILISTITLLTKKKMIFSFKKIFILILLVLICCLPHLTIARSFGVYLSSLFALALIAKLIDVLFFFINVPGNRKSYFSFLLMSLLLISGTLGGIYRSTEHAKSMSQYSLSIIRFDALFIYGYKNENTKVTIPIQRYLQKEKHLKDLKIYDFNWGDDLKGESEKLVKTNYEPLSF